MAGQLTGFRPIARIEAMIDPLIARGRLDRGDGIAGLIRYGVMGLSATMVYFAVAVGVHRAGVGPNLTSAIAIAVSVMVSFLAQSRVTFRARGFEPSEAARFLAVGAIGLTVSRLSVSIVHLRAGQPFWVAALVVCFVVPVANFVAMNFWVFARPQTAAGGWARREGTTP